MASKDDIFDKVKVDRRRTKDIHLGRVGNAYCSTKNMAQTVLKVSSYSSGVRQATLCLNSVVKFFLFDTEHLTCGNFTTYTIYPLWRANYKTHIVSI